MVGTDTYRRNDDGTYSSEYGHTVSKAPNGSLWVGGAPTGLQCIIGTQIYGSGEADIPTMTSDWVIADI